MINLRSRRPSINLALQGGGAFGAFTWGVLDRLLDDPSLHFDSISGTSAGSINAVAMASGYLDNGRDGARRRLQDIWHAIADSSSQFSIPHPAPGIEAIQQTLHKSAQVAFERLSQVMSPYELNPLDINPLRYVLEANIDFDKLKNQSDLELLIAATAISTGKRRIFRNRELTVETVLASSCLPTLFKAIEIDGEYYWDGGYSANPDLKTLISECHARDTIIVLLNPLKETRLPKTPAEISDNINRITFNQPFLTECDYINLCRNQAKRILLSRQERKMIRHRFHAIHSAEHTGNLAPGSKSTPNLEMFLNLYRSGRKETELWYSENRKHLGRKTTFEVFQ